MKRKGQSVLVSVAIILTIVVVAVLLISIKNYVIGMRKNSIYLSQIQHVEVTTMKTMQLKTKEILSGVYFTVLVSPEMINKLNEYISVRPEDIQSYIPLVEYNTSLSNNIFDFRLIYFDVLNNTISTVLKNLTFFEVNVDESKYRELFGERISITNVFLNTPINYNGTPTNSQINNVCYCANFTIEEVNKSITQTGDRPIFKIVIPHVETTISHINLYIPASTTSTVYTTKKTNKPAITPKMIYSIFSEYPDIISSTLPIVLAKYQLDLKNAQEIIMNSTYLLVNPTIGSAIANGNILNYDMNDILFSGIIDNWINVFDIDQTNTQDNLDILPPNINSSTPIVNITKNGFVGKAIISPSNQHYSYELSQINNYLLNLDKLKYFVYYIIYGTPYIQDMDFLYNTYEDSIAPLLPYEYFSPQSASANIIDNFNNYYISYNDFYKYLNHYLRIKRGSNINNYHMATHLINILPSFYNYGSRVIFNDTHPVLAAWDNFSSITFTSYITPLGFSLLKKPYFSESDSYGTNYRYDTIEIFNSRITYTSQYLNNNIDNPQFDAKKLVEIVNATLPFTILSLKQMMIDTNNLHLINYYNFDRYLEDKFANYELNEQSNKSTTITKILPYGLNTTDEITAYKNLFTVQAINGYIRTNYNSNVPLSTMLTVEKLYPVTTLVELIYHIRPNQLPVMIINNKSSQTNDLNNTYVTFWDVFGNSDIFVSPDEAPKIMKYLMPVNKIDNDKIYGNMILPYSYIINVKYPINNELNLYYYWTPIAVNDNLRGNLLQFLSQELVILGKNDYINEDDIQKILSSINNYKSLYKENFVGGDLISSRILTEIRKINISENVEVNGSKLLGYWDDKIDKNYFISVSSLVPTDIFIKVNKYQRINNVTFDENYNANFIKKYIRSITLEPSGTFSGSDVNYSVLNYTFEIEDDDSIVIISPGKCTIYLRYDGTYTVSGCPKDTRVDRVTVSKRLSKTVCSGTVPNGTVNVRVVEQDLTGLHTYDTTATFKYTNTTKICYAEANPKSGKTYTVEDSETWDTNFVYYKNREINLKTVLKYDGSSCSYDIYTDNNKIATLDGDNDKVYILSATLVNNEDTSNYIIVIARSCSVTKDTSRGTLSISGSVTFEKIEGILPLIYNVTTVDTINYDALVYGYYMAYDPYLLSYGVETLPKTIYGTNVIDRFYSLVFTRNDEMRIGSLTWYTFTQMEMLDDIIDNYYSVSAPKYNKKYWETLMTVWGTFDNAKATRNVLYYDPYYLLLTGETIVFPVRFPLKNIEVKIIYNRLLGIDAKSIYSGTDIRSEYPLTDSFLDIDLTYTIATKIGLTSLGMDYNTFQQYKLLDLADSYLKGVLHKIQIKYGQTTSVLYYPSFDNALYDSYGGTIKSMPIN